MVALTFRMPAGIPGDVNRAQHHTVEAQVITPFGTTGHPTAFGIPVAIDATSHQVRALAASDTAAAVYGLLVRPFPSVSSQDPVGTSTPTASGACDVLRRGYMSVLLSGGVAAVKGAPVYVWNNTATGAHIQGGFEASSPAASNGFAINAVFMGPADASNITEIEYNI